MTQPLYAIGDIHGQIDMLHTALERIAADGGPDARIIFLGDYVDRGPDSKGVLDLLSDGLEQGRNWICLKGNHDRMFQWFLEDVPRQDPHLLLGYHYFHDRIGGIETLRSYGIDIPDRIRLMDLHTIAREVIPQGHIDLLNALPTSHIEAETLFVHAGIRPGIALDQQVEDDLVWIRDSFLTHDQPHPWQVVHGHTTVQSPEHHGNRINLDTGAGYGRALTAAVFEGAKAWTLTDQGRLPLDPQ